MNDRINVDFKYLKNFKTFSNGYGKVSDWDHNGYKIGDRVFVTEQSDKRPNENGVIVVPTDIHKVKKDETFDMVKVEFADGKSDYINRSFIRVVSR